MKKLLSFLIIFTLFLSACTPTRDEKDSSESTAEEMTESIQVIDIENEEKPTELTIYMTGTLVTRMGRWGKEHEEKVSYHITDFTVGPYGVLTNAAQEHGHMFYDPIKEFEQETGITINIKTFQNMETIESQIMKDKEKGKQGPDIIIGDFSGWGTDGKHNNIQRLIYNGWFTDMMPCLENDQVYTSNEYYNEVLEAGVLSGGQYVLPLCFNMNGIFTSKEDMNNLGVIIEEGMTSTQLLEQLKQACVLAEKGQLTVDSLSTYSVVTAFLQDYWESTGCSVVDYETGEATLDRELFEDVTEFFKEYLKMNVVEDWDTVLESADRVLSSTTWDAYVSPGDLETLDWNFRSGYQEKDIGLERINQGVFYYENSTLTTASHSLPGQSVTLSTMYGELNEEMIMVGVPMYEENDQYMAQVQQYGCISSESKYPYHCYQLLKYLLDQEYDPYYVIPVKKANAETALEKLSSTVYTFHIWLGATWEEEQDFTKARDTYDVQPLPDNLKQQLQHMLDNIGGASLPEASVYVPLVWHMEAYAFELETMDEAYENACADLEKHMEYIMAGDSEMDFGSMGYKASFLK